MGASLHPDTEIVINVEKPVAGGRMLARYAGQVVFVVGAIPGERVRARVERVSRQLAYAEVVDVLEESPDRREPNVHLACGGSLYAHIAYSRQLSLKSELIADAFARIGKIILPSKVDVAASSEEGYRIRARLHVRGGRIGFFREGTHELCDPGPTRQLLPATVTALRRLEERLKAKEITSGVCELAENLKGDERVVFIEADQDCEGIGAIDHIDGITGIVPAGYGPENVTDTINAGAGDIVLTHHVRSFFQGNRFLLTSLAGRVVSMVPDGDVVDLYSGVGLFAISLASAGRSKVVAVEGDRFSAKDLQINAAPYSAHVAVKPVSVERFLDDGRVGTPRTLVLDPPRTGVSGEAMTGIVALKSERVVYVSCDAATMARDARRLIEGGYQLERIEGFDMFPNTPHVETVTSFVREPRAAG